MSSAYIKNSDSKNVSINYKFTIESVDHERFEPILELDGITYQMLIDSLDVLRNKEKVF